MNASKTESSVGQGEKFREREEMGGAFILDNIRHINKQNTEKREFGGGSSYFG